MLDPLLICISMLFSQTGNAKVATELLPHTSIQASLLHGIPKIYSLNLDSNTVVELVLEQGGADMAMTIMSPDGARILIDSREDGPEPAVLAGAAGTYLVEINTKRQYPVPVFFKLEVGNLRARQEDDTLRLEAQRLSTEAKQHDSGKPAALREAVDLAAKAVELWHTLGERDAEASVQLQLGAYLIALSEFDSATNHLLQALSLAREESDQWTEGSALSNLAVIRWQSGDFAETISSVNQALAIWRELGNVYGESVALNTLGLRYRAIGSYQQAAKSYRQSLAILRSLGDRDHEAFVRNNLGVLLQALNEDSEALASFKQAAALYHAAGNTRSEARAMLHMARIQVEAHRNETARRYITDALPLAQNASDYRTVGDAWILLGNLSSRDMSQALQSYDKALSVYRKISNHEGEAATLFQTGLLYSRAGRPEQAEDYLRQSLGIRHSLGIRDDEAETLYQLAKVERTLGKLSDARSHILAALDLTESIRTLVAGPQLRMSYLASKIEYYSFACDLYRQLNDENPNNGFAQAGFAIAERGHARSLLDLLAEARAGIGKGLSEKFRTRERKLHETMNVLTEQIGDLSKQNNKEALEAATHKLDAAFEDYRQLEAEIRESDPGYALLAPRPLEAEEIQHNVLDTGTVLFEYVLGTEKSCLWVLTPDSVSLFDLPARPLIEKAVRSYFAELEGANHNHSASAPDILPAASVLSGMLLPPKLVLPKNKRILVVADGVLQRVPFDALPEREHGAPLIEDHEIVLSPSASVLVEQRNRVAGRRAPLKTIAVIADPVFDAGDARTANPASGVKPAFPRLPYTRREADEILNLAPADKSLRALDFSAQKSLLTSKQLMQFKIIHIATHASLNKTEPELSELIFSLVDKSGRSMDGHFPLYQIASLNLPAQLVTLSACGTGLGHEVSGEGTVGLAREFIRGGANTVVVSLWDVEDDSTAELMKLFYAGILGPRHLHPAAALREAQRSMLHSKRWQPYQWSGWLAVGDWR